jgi:hypothetical protein
MTEGRKLDHFEEKTVNKRRRSGGSLSPKAEQFTIENYDVPFLLFPETF